jgi:outer membrane lipoprotein-sorting protein
MRALVLGLLLLAGCSAASAPVAPRPGAGTAQEQQWRAAALADYRYDFEQQCFCIAEQRQPVTIEVRGGRVSRVLARATGQPVAASENVRWHTVDDLFRLIAEAKANQSELRVAYDPRLGYPTRVEIGSLAADAGVIYIAGNLRPL